MSHPGRWKVIFPVGPVGTVLFSCHQSPASGLVTGTCTSPEVLEVLEADGGKSGGGSLRPQGFYQYGARIADKLAKVLSPESSFLR